MNRLSIFTKLLGVAIVVTGCVFSGAVQGEVIKAGDAVEISLRGVPLAEQQKVNGIYRVRDSGNIRIPIINVNVKAVGRKPEDVERSIELAFKNAQIYTMPTITLAVRKGEKIDVRKVVLVGGEVRRPGRVQFRDGMTLMEAVEQAGGRATFASKFLYLTRKNPRTGKLERHKLIYKDPKTKSLKLMPDDLINVPERGPIIDRG